VRDAETFVRYLEDFWAEGSQYLAGQEARLKPLLTVYVINARSAIPQPFVTAYQYKVRDVVNPKHLCGSYYRTLTPGKAGV